MRWPLSHPLHAGPIAHCYSIIGNQARAAGEEFVDQKKEEKKPIYLHVRFKGRRSRGEGGGGGGGVLIKKN